MARFGRAFPLPRRGVVELFPKKYILSANSGTYNITGGTAGLTIKWHVAGASGSYTITGGAAGLTLKWHATGTSGSYTITGSAAGLTIKWHTAASSGSYLITGYAAALIAKLVPPLPGVISKKIPRSDGSRKALQKILDRADPNKFVAREERRLKSLSQLEYKHVRAMGGNRLLDLEDFARKITEERERDDEEAIINLLSHL